MFEKDRQILRVPRDADPETVRKAYVKLSRRYPPEHFPEKFKQVKGAYDRLTLDWSSIKPLFKQMAAIDDDPKQMASFLLHQALQESSASRQEVPELDLHSLEPILNAPTLRQELAKVLEDIRSQGLDYRSGKQE